MDLKKSMLERLKKREEKLLGYIAKIRRQIEAGKLGGEAGRLWLEKYAVGNGLNIGCGEFGIGNAFGVDGDIRVLGTDLWAFADHYVGDIVGPLDFIVTNYLDCFPNVLTILKQWHTQLKQDGIVAVVTPNADWYKNREGPLTNKHRLHCFTPKTLQFYFERAGFDVINSELYERELRMVGKKKN